MAAMTAADEKRVRLTKHTISFLQRYGEVLTKHMAMDDVMAWEEENIRSGVNVCDRDFGWLNISDFGIADISCASTGEGGEIMYNLFVLNHPTLVLHEKGTGTKIFKQMRHPLLTLKQYEDEPGLEAAIDGYIRSLKPTHRLYPNLIEIDGIDSCGKGVLYDVIKQWAIDDGLPVCDLVGINTNMEANVVPSWEKLKKHITPGCKVLLVAEPMHAGIGKIVRGEITNKDANKENPYSPLSTAHAYALDRDVLYKRLVIPALEEGVIVVSDRGAITSLVYQPIQAEMYSGYSRDLFLGHVLGMPGNQRELSHVPGLLALQQIAPEVAMAWQKNREKQDEVIFETLDFQQRAAMVYASDWLKEFFERRGSQVLHIAPGATPAETSQKFRRVWEDYYHERIVEPRLRGYRMSPQRMLPVSPVELPFRT
jgi:thymidylate kinase